VVIGTTKSQRLADTQRVHLEILDRGRRCVTVRANIILYLFARVFACHERQSLDAAGGGADSLEQQPLTHCHCLGQPNVISRESFGLGMVALGNSFYGDNPLNGSQTLRSRPRTLSPYKCRPRGFLAATLPPPPIIHVRRVRPI
jgi:hypothetical protein